MTSFHTGRTAQALTACLFLIAACGENSAGPDRALNVAPGTFDGGFLVLSDADLFDTKDEDENDTLSLFRNGAPVADLALSNSALAGGSVLDISPDGRLAFLAETRGPVTDKGSNAADAAERFTTGTQVMMVSVGPDRLRQADATKAAGVNPQSVDFAPETGFALAATEYDKGELVSMKINVDGSIADMRRIDLPITYLEDDRIKTIRSAHLAPDGRTLAVNIAGRRLQAYRLETDRTGMATSATPLGPESAPLGTKLHGGAWSPDGAFYIIADKDTASAKARLLVVRAGDPNTQPVQVAQAELIRVPAEFDFDPDGRQIAVVDNAVSSEELFTETARRPVYGISLFEFDRETGALTFLDRVTQPGFGAGDVVFDATGTNLAVSVGTRKNHDYQGAIDFFTIGETGLSSQGKTQPVSAGAHALVRVPDITEVLKRLR